MTRLPTPGGDAGNWGTILNEYLSTVHNTDGSLKSGVVAGSHLADGSVTTDKLADASITTTKLASSVQTTLSSVVTTSSLGVAGGIASLDSSGKVPASQLPQASGGTTPEASATVSGTIRLSGDLGGTANSPIVTKLSGVSLSGTPSAGQALVATSSTVAGWQSISTGGSTNPNAGTVWNTTSDPATGATASSVKDGDMWVDTSHATLVSLKNRINGQWVEVSSATKPVVQQPATSDLVTGLSVGSITSTGLTLSWTAPANPSGTVDGYHVYNNGTKLTSTLLTTTTYNVTLPASTAYSLTVASVVAGQEKTPSTAVTGTTPGGQPATGLAWPLKVSTNGRYIVDANDAPFIWQGDTAWRLFSGLNREQTIQYLDTRKDQGFNVIQAVAIPRVETANATNRYGDEPTSGGSVANRVITNGSDFADASQYDYWDHVDFVVNETNSRDMVMGLLPAWSTSMVGNEINDSNAQGYGEFIGARYKNKKIIWILGGDNNNSYNDSTWDALAKGIAIGINGTESYDNILMTYHPGGAMMGSHFHSRAWNTFNMEQSSHSNAVSYAKVEQDYSISPAKPAIDGEPLYEDHPFNWDPNQGFSTPHHVRAREYCAVFAGAFGFTYGHHAVWPMKLTKELYNNNLTWDEAILRPGATQMQHLRKLIESRPILTRVPDQSLITSDQGALNGKDVNTRRQATRDESGSYIMVYLTSGGDVSIDTTKLSSTSAKQWWYNPRTGQAGTAEDKTLSGTMTFSAPSSEDWVLVLDDASRNFPAPGTV